MQARLTVVAGAHPGTFRLKLPTVVGRSHDARLKVRQAHVSRRHCEIAAEDGVLVVRDLGSSNGTFVNDRRIEEPTTLSPGDQLRVGTIVLRADYQAATIRPIGVAPTQAADQTMLSRVPADDRNSVIDEPASRASESVSSVVKYHETDGGSFLGIHTTRAAETARVDAAEFAEQFKLEVEEPPSRSVDAGDSRLNDFLNKLE